jgi:RES domain-containing protein
MTGPDPIYDPGLLDALEGRTAGPWEERVWRHVFEGTDPSAANIRGSRWNPPGVEAIYASLDQDTAIAEIDHLIAMQPYPITRPRVTHEMDVHLSRVADLTNQADLENLGLDIEVLKADGKDLTQTIGGAVAWLGIGGLLVPSMRHAGTNLVIFVNSADPDDYWKPSDPIPYRAP